MSFFAVIRDAEGDFELQQCHLNLWCLGGIVGRNTFVWDVGLRVKGKGNKKVSRFLLALPFGSADGLAEDLRQRLKDQTTAELVFGNPVNITGDQLNYDGTAVDLGFVETSRLIPDKSGKDYSLWDITFAPALEEPKEVYLRIRFRVVQSGRTWTWKWSLLRKNGALVDIRVADIREARAVSAWAAYRDRIMPIEKLNLLIVAPDYLQPRAISPELRYMRLLESDAWQGYLGQKPNLRRKRRMIIYHWRSKDSVVNVKTPFLAFMNLARDYSFIRLGDHVRGAIVLLILVFITYALSPLTLTGWTWVEKSAADNKWASLVTGASILAIVFGTYKQWPLIKTLSAWIVRTFHTIERFFLRPNRP